MIHLPVAYIGPGAGFAFLGSFLTFVLSLVASAVSLLLWPLRLLRSMWRGRRVARARQVIVLALDGLDFDRAEALMDAGRLPSLARLREQGSCRPLGAAEWSAFAGREPFWKILGRNAVGSTVMFVPGSFPPEAFEGRILAADSAAAGRKSSSFRFAAAGDALEGELPSGVKFRIVDPQGEPALAIGGETYALKPHVFTPWIRLRSGGVHGIVRFLGATHAGGFSLYASAMQPDPERPETPLSYPRRYSAYLAKLLGSFATLPEAGDEAALYEGAIEAEDFLMQVKLAQEEREALFASALEHQAAGLVACAFDTARRIEHVFGEHGEVVEWAYREMDRVVGRALDAARPGAVVLVVSRGVLFANRKLETASAALEDIAPTVLALFGIARPDWMEGRPVIRFA